MNIVSDILKIRKLLNQIIAEDAAENDPFNFELEDDFNEMINSIKVVEAIYPSSIVMLCKRQHPAIPYISSNVSDLLGYTAELVKNLSIEEYFTLVHPDDHKGVKHCFDYMKDVIVNQGAILNPKKFRFVFFYRMRKKSGEYLWIRDEKIVIENHQKRMIGITLLNNFNKDNHYFQVKVELNKYSNSQLIKIHEFVPRLSKTKITNREVDVIRLIDQGLSNKEISESLNISINTVKNHRKNLFVKTNSKNSIELIRFAKNENIV